jgi:hypothetical protein
MSNIQRGSLVAGAADADVSQSWDTSNRTRQPRTSHRLLHKNCHATARTSSTRYTNLDNMHPQMKRFRISHRTCTSRYRSAYYTLGAVLPLSASGQHDSVIFAKASEKYARVLRLYIMMAFSNSDDAYQDLVIDFFCLASRRTSGLSYVRDQPETDD